MESVFSYTPPTARNGNFLTAIIGTFYLAFNTRRCGLNVLKYLELVMNRFQKWRGSVIPADVIDSVLPWNDEIRELCALSV